MIARCLYERWARRSVLGLFGVIAVSCAVAQQSEPTPLDQVTITATRLEQSVFAVPYVAQVIDRLEFVDRRAVRTLPDALLEVPGIMVQRTTYGQASPFIRGFTGFRTLMLIDGIRLNNAVFREGPNQYWGTVDLHAIDRIEIVKGPSSVLYGSDAIGGTLNAITHSLERADAARDSGISGQLSGYYRHATGEDSHEARLGVRLQPAAKLALGAGLTYKDFGDLRGGDSLGLQPNTGYREVAGDFKARYRFSDGLRLTAAYQRNVQDDVPRTHATRFGRSFAGTQIGTDLQRDLDQLRELAYVRAESIRPAPWIDRSQLTISWHRQTEEQDRVRSNGRREILGLSDVQLGVHASFESVAERGTWIYGVEYYEDDVESYGYERLSGGGVRHMPRGSVAGDARYGHLGVYVQDQFRIAPRWEATAGLRYSHVSAEATQVDPDPTDAVIYGPLDRQASALTASVRLRADVARNVALFGGVSQGFRAPNISDYTSFELARSGERETPAPDLTPEKYVSFEIGAKARLERLRTELQVAAFHTAIENQIARFPTGRMLDTEREVTKANVGDGFTRGFEASATVRVTTGLSLVARLAWLEGETDVFVDNDRVRAPATRIQPFTVTAGPRWNSADRRVWVEAVGQFTRHQSRLSPGDVGDVQRIPPGGTPGYDVYSVRAGWRARSDLTLTAVVENILDEDYRIHGSGVNEPGFNVVLAARFGY